MDQFLEMDHFWFWSVFDKTDCIPKKIFQWASRSIFSPICIFIIWICRCTFCTFNGEIIWCTSHRYCDSSQDRFLIYLKSLRSYGAKEQLRFWKPLQEKYARLLCRLYFLQNRSQCNMFGLDCLFYLESPSISTGKNSRWLSIWTR